MNDDNILQKIKENPECIKEIEVLTEEMQLVAVKAYHGVVEYIKNPTANVFLYLLDQDWNYIELIDRLNELSRISKVRALTENEIQERDDLRKIYIKQFRQGFAQTLDNVKVIDEKGKDVTPHKKGKA